MLVPIPRLASNTAAAPEREYSSSSKVMRFRELSTTSQVTGAYVMSLVTLRESGIELLRSAPT